MNDCPLELERPGKCAWCRKQLTGRRTRWCSTLCSKFAAINHRWTQAKQFAKELATWYQCAACLGFFRVVEVNHIVPCKGKHGIWGCHHHQTNLEVLCIPCHRIKTAKQRAAGWI